MTLGWVWSYFTFDVGVRLITGDRPQRPRAGSERTYQRVSNGKTMRAKSATSPQPEPYQTVT